MAALVTPLWLPLPAGSIEMAPLKEWLGIIWPFPAGVVLAVLGWLLTRPFKGKSPPAGDLWWLYAFIANAALVPIRLIGHACGKIKAASVAAAQSTGKEIHGLFITRIGRGELVAASF